jgi:hypothetical protein
MGLLGVNLLNHGLIIIDSCVVKRKQFWGGSQVLTGGCCKEVGLCYKNWNWDSKIVVAMDRWSLWTGGRYSDVIVSSGLIVREIADEMIVQSVSRI